MNKNLITCPNGIPERKKEWYVFLAGPIQGAPDWQFDMPDIKNVVWLSPRRQTYVNFDYEEQTLWEQKMMSIADVILFWIPNQKEKVAGREYAQTTRTEFGEYLGRGKKVMIGIEDDKFSGYRYFVTKSKQYKTNVNNSLSELISELKEYISECEKKKTVYFTSDTHFSSDRALELSKRPFLDVDDMDLKLIEKWNNTVKPCDVLIHCGDFGDYSKIKYLNGKEINLLFGNYEYKEIGNTSSKEYAEMLKAEYRFDKIFIKPTKIKINKNYFVIGHEPIETKDFSDKNGNIFCLFGHIHGRQKIKKFGMDVGTDSNNYMPISIDDVLFYKNAIEKGFYDNEVFVQ